ncbi:30S ribosomal protein S4e [Candidatus Woesearchaeota archaeon]|nr:30S ribosomal protein S4e [Candidatus Woesearchaeota archaeon]
MAQHHLKRIAAPKTWDILRKRHVFITRPNPGAHPLTHSTSLNTFMKELARVADTRKEAKRIIKEQEVLVDGKRRHDERYNVGFMDVISFPKTKQHYRLGFSAKGKLQAIPIPEKEAKLKIARIDGKRTVSKGKTQIQLSDGRTIITDKDEYAVGDSLLITLPEQEVKQRLALKEGASIIVYKGKHAGMTGTLQGISGDAAVIKTEDKEFGTKRAYVYITGEQQPAITCSP